jgi:ribonucleotide reductase alpha subunit
MADVRDKGRLQDVIGVPEALKRVFVTALEVPVEQHLQMQAAFQHEVDNSVSKTINLPQDATPEDVAYALASVGARLEGHHHLSLREQSRAGDRVRRQRGSSLL